MHSVMQGAHQRLRASARAPLKPQGTGCHEQGRSFFPQNCGLPKKGLYPWEGGGGKWQRYWCAAPKRW